MSEKSIAGKRVLYFNGQSFDAEKLLVRIFRQAKESITVIDDRLSRKTLELISAAKKNVPVLIYSDNTKDPDMLTRSGMKQFLALNPPLRLLIGTTAGMAPDCRIIIDSDTPRERVYLLSDSIAGTEDACILLRKESGSEKELLNRLQENPYLILQ